MSIRAKWLAIAVAASPFSAAVANNSEEFRAILSPQLAPNVLNAKEKVLFSAIYNAIRTEKWDEPHV